MSKKTLLKDLEDMRTQMKLEGRTEYVKTITTAIEFITSVKQIMEKILSKNKLHVRRTKK